MALAHLFPGPMCTHLSQFAQVTGKPARAGGFTLVELMVVSGVISLAAAIAVPSYLQWNAKYQLKQAVIEVTSQLAVSRIAAMNRNTTVGTQVTVASGQLAIAAIDAAGTPVFQQTTSVPHVSNMGPTTVQFNSLGLRSGGGAGDLVMTVDNDKGLRYSIRVTPGGKSSWCPKSTCP